ncbi:MAG: hypothetical protein IPN69_02495 [Acidobacteria bacterium]|nr:hypothetical protein [Acidobacteriota bacterium]
MKRRSKVLDLVIVSAVALALPVGFVAQAAMHKCDPTNPGDLCDALDVHVVDATVLFWPIIWLIGIAISGFGFLIGRRAHPDNRDLNKLDLIKLN